MGPIKFAAIRQTKKPAARITLETPYSLDWPTIKSPDIFLQAVTSTLEPLNISKLKKVKLEMNSKLTWKEKNNLKRQQSKEIWDNCSCHRRHLVLGMSNALRSLEKDELCALLLCLDVSPKLMIDPFVPLCVTRKVPAAAVPKLGETLQRVLNFKSCKALGLKRSVAEDPSNVFYRLYELIQTTAPRLIGTNIDAVELTHRIEAPSIDGTHRRPPPPVERPSDKDYTHLYVKKVDVKTVVVRADEFLSLDMNETPEQNRLEADFISVNRKRTYKEMKIKRVRPSGKIKRKKSKNIPKKIAK